MVEGQDSGQDATHFGSGEHDGQFELRISSGQFKLVRPNAFERFFPEELDGANGLSAGLAGDLFVDLEMDAILTNLLGGNQLGRFGVEFAELADAGVISLFGARADGQEFEIIGKGF